MVAGHKLPKAMEGMNRLISSGARMMRSIYLPGLVRTGRYSTSNQLIWVEHSRQQPFPVPGTVARGIPDREQMHSAIWSSSKPMDINQVISFGPITLIRPINGNFMKVRFIIPTPIATTIQGQTWLRPYHGSQNI